MALASVVRVPLVCPRCAAGVTPLCCIPFARGNPVPAGPAGAAANYTSVAQHLVHVVSANLRRLVLSGVAPSEVGIFIGPAEEGRPLTLSPLHAALQVEPPSSP